jgi:hypothetical protein
MRHGNRPIGARRGAALVALALAGAVAGWAQSSPAKDAQVTVKENVTAQDARSKPESANPEKRAKGEGIQVHGHWTIEVRDPDGTLKAHREFENSLVGVGAGNGADLLTGLLLGTVTPGGFSLALNGLGPIILPLGPACTMAPACNVTLKAMPGAGFTVSGTVFNAPAGKIVNVVTAVGTCPGTVAPSSCFINSNVTNTPGLTSKDLTAAPIAVTAGQTVSVTVQITFM